MTDETTAIAALNQLLAAEQQNPARRLSESTLFVSRLDVEARDVLCAMGRTGRENCAALTELILDLGGRPALRPADASTAHLHYIELHRVLPRLVADQQALERACALAAARLAGEPRAAALVNRILDHHREDLARIQSLAARLATVPRA